LRTTKAQLTQAAWAQMKDQIRKPPPLRDLVRVSALERTSDRILVVAPQPFYEDRGTPIAVRHLVASLVESGYAVDLLTYPIGADIDVGGARIIRSRNVLGLRSVPVGLSWRKLVLDLFMTLQLRDMLRRVDYRAIHAVEEMAFAAVTLAARHGVPVVYDMQSSLPDQLRSRLIFRSGMMQRLLLGAERWLVGRADAVVCSAGLASYVRRVHALAPAMEWKFPGATSPGRSDGCVPRRSELGLRNNARIVLYTGTFATYQGLSNLIDAMVDVVAFNSNVVLVLIGATEGRGPPQSDNAVKLAASGHLVVLPRQSHAVIPQFLAMAEILVSPRVYGDNVPLKIFDYLRAGKPIVVTDTAGHRSVLDDEVALFVGRDAASMATGLIRLLANPEFAQTLADAAKNRALTSHNEKTFSTLVSRLYKQVLSATGARTEGGQEDRFPDSVP
jgi:glycosyltransferase involved in cell wall biosynthesis